jgi:Rieske Fe-S protein
VGIAACAGASPEEARRGHSHEHSWSAPRVTRAQELPFPIRHRRAGGHRRRGHLRRRRRRPTPVTLRLIRQDGYRQVVERRVVYIQRDETLGVRVLDSTCTHLGCRTRYDDASKHFVCPCHGGVYDMDGSVLDGPPPAPLRRLEARIDGTDVVVQV